jgi:hypothetical protein
MPHVVASQRVRFGQGGFRSSLVTLQRKPARQVGRQTGRARGAATAAGVSGGVRGRAIERDLTWPNGNAKLSSRLAESRLEALFKEHPDRATLIWESPETEFPIASGQFFQLDDYVFVWKGEGRVVFGSNHPRGISRITKSLAKARNGGDGY